MRAAASCLAAGCRRRGRRTSSSGSKAPQPNASPPPPPPDPAARRTFFENARLMLTAEGGAEALPSRPQVTDSWDWHAWQVFVACLPAAAIYAGVVSVRAERAAAEERAGGVKGGEATTVPVPPAPAALATLEARLAALEAKVAAAKAVEAPVRPPPATANLPGRGGGGEGGSVAASASSASFSSSLAGWWAWATAWGRRRE